MPKIFGQPAVSPSKLGQDSVSVLFVEQIHPVKRDALHQSDFQLVHTTGQPRGLLLVAGRAVATRQRVQLREQIAGVAHVAPYRAVGPTHRVGVEPEVQCDELGDGRDVVVGVPQRGHALARHPCADRVVVAEIYRARDRDEDVRSVSAGTLAGAVCDLGGDAVHLADFGSIADRLTDTRLQMLDIFGKTGS